MNRFERAFLCLICVVANTQDFTEPLPELSAPPDDQSGDRGLARFFRSAIDDGSEWEAPISVSREAIPEDGALMGLKDYRLFGVLDVVIIFGPLD